MRVLPQRLGPDSENAVGQASKPHRRGDGHGFRSSDLPMRQQHPDCRGRSKGGARHEEEGITMTSKTPLSRRNFFKGAGGLIIGFSLADSSVLPELLGAPQRGGQGAGPDAVPGAPSAGRLDAWLHVERDGTIRVFTGKVDIGMGVETALAQIVAEELDVQPSRVALVMGDTSTTVDQGGIGGSNSISGGGRSLRNVAATARALLLQMASPRLGVPQDQLEVRNGIVRVKTDSSKAVSYADL